MPATFWYVVAEPSNIVSHLKHLQATIAESTVLLAIVHPIYEIIAGRIELRRLYDSTSQRYSVYVEGLEKGIVILERTF